MTKDILKFFQAYVTEMIDIGGENLPKSIASGLGEKLAKIYKKIEIDEIKDGIKHIYDILEIQYEIKDIERDKFEVEVKFDENFCPIGGEFNPDKAKLIQKSICDPYMLGFLAEMEPEYRYEGCIKQCILENGNQKVCRYIIERVEKEDD
ncbi:MAG: hypothetical protein KGD63_08375 [Candidatus Lokiarchaeota archaeon]|nr:hypothetical protein [Candidatus Lokiarchaeota archaeon]